MEIDAIEAKSRSTATSTARGSRFNSDNRRATVANWSATAAANLGIAQRCIALKIQSWQALKSSAMPTTCSRPLFQNTIGASRCGAPYWLEWRTWPPSDNRSS
ncbi:hypothetical protein PF003_g25612 [Phytophthora fragariae]|nr:hypothetical protein PF003_g25612 [Phytophthora fragariae]